MRHILNIKLKIDKILPGLLITILIAITAKFLSNNYNVPAMLMAILIGMSLNFLSDEKRFTYGINYSSKNILYFGIVLLGSRISLDTILIIDLDTILIVTLGVIFTIFFSIILLKILKFPLSFGILIGGAIAICGASAAIAISSVLPKNENMTIKSAVCFDSDINKLKNDNNNYYHEKDNMLSLILPKDRCKGDQIKDKITHMVNNPDKYGPPWSEFVNCALENSNAAYGDVATQCGFFKNNNKN